MKKGFMGPIIKRIAIQRALLIIEAAYNGVRNKTPVITGETRESWFFELDGKKIYGIPTLEDLSAAKRVSLRNDEAHIGQLEDKYAIIALTEIEVRDVIAYLSRRKKSV